MSTNHMDENFRQLYSLLRELRDEAAETRTSTGILAERSTQISDHLKVLNGRTAKAEERVAQLELIRANEHLADLKKLASEHAAKIAEHESWRRELIGGWKLIGLIATAAATFGAGMSAVFFWIAEHLKK